MRPYLNNYINTLSHRRQERVSSLMEEARVGKEQLSTLISRLDRSVAGGNALVLDRDREQTLMRAQRVVGNIESISERVEELFEVSNAIAVLLNSHAGILSSDVKAIEDELLAMEKMVFNFAFLLSDNQAYDYAYLESFVDEQNRDTELITLPDRSALPFGPADHAFVHTSEGSLALPESVLNSHGMSVNIVRTNSGAFTIADTGLKNILKSGSSTGWKRTMLTGGPINAPLPEGEGRAGSQIVLEFSLVQPAPASEIRIVPYADMSVELLQVITYKSEDDTEGTPQLDGIRWLDRPFTLHFPMESVHKFRVVLNQPTYHRVTKHEDVLEYRYNHMLESINERRQGPNDTYKRVYFVNVIEQAILLEAMGQGNQSISLPATNMQPERGPMDIANLVLAFRFDRPSLWTEDSGENAFILFDVLQQTDSDVKDIQRHGGDFDVTKNVKMLATDNPISQVVDKALDIQVIESGFTYYYNMGLHYVGIGVESPGFKGVYVSEALPAPGDIGVVRIKTEDSNYFASQSARHSNQITSIEYSVSNRSTPENENDWRPILPVGTESVKAERFFLDEDGRGFFRFPANAAEQISIFRNGYSMGFGGPGVQVIGGNVPGTIAGAKINLAAIAPEDIFTCDYHPMDDNTVVSFEDEDYELPPLVFAFDAGGSGERFLATEDRNTVTLASRPYVDPALAAAGNYQPIVVQMDDGTIPQNLTDYRDQRSVALPPDDYYYIHSGNTLMFNRPIATPFRVYYQYLQNNVRFRVVLRCNVRDFVSPAVDYVHLKAKTRNPDARSI